MVQKWVHRKKRRHSDCVPTISFSHVDSAVLIAVPGPDGTMITTKENGTVKIHQSELVCLFETKFDAKIISLVNGPTQNVYFAGTDTGYLAIVHVERDKFEIIDSSRLFKGGVLNSLLRVLEL